MWGRLWSFAFDDIAKMVTDKLEERAIAERTRLQRADHEKQLLDNLGKRKNGKGYLAKEEDDPSKTGKGKKEKKVFAALTPEEKKEKRKLQRLKKEEGKAEENQDGDGFGDFGNFE